MEHDAQDPPLALDSDFAQSDTAWAKAMERLKSILAMTVHLKCKDFFTAQTAQKRSRIGIGVYIGVADLAALTCTWLVNANDQTPLGHSCLFFVKTFLLNGVSI